MYEQIQQNTRRSDVSPSMKTQLSVVTGTPLRENHDMKRGA